MGSASEEMANQLLSLFQPQQHQSSDLTLTQMGFFSLPQNSAAAAEEAGLDLFSLNPRQQHHLHYLASAFAGAATSTTTLPSSPSSLWDRDRDVDVDVGRGKNNGGGDGGGGCRAMKMKRIKGRKKVREPRFCFKTMSDVDVLDDGYKWRKYGQKVVKNTLHPRSYYRCTEDKCRVKKRVERLAEDPRMVITTYEGRHAHSPSRDNLEETMGQLPSGHLSNIFW
ncbi:probable WRKY transcription factor 24 [Momordica charantia]|uniref:Probable WRKY transcription factor 24 n=1 Tax=Momordica charantia TaxID=3673 RepID=A0A6J1BTZ1_MOMCH|nr:probable WRKY transcription factor 24 [Momordica charantia]